MEKNRHEDLAEKHLKNLSKESHTIISNQLSKKFSLILKRDSCQRAMYYQKNIVGTYRLDKIPTKKLFIMHTVDFSETLTASIKDILYCQLF